MKLHVVVHHFLPFLSLSLSHSLPLVCHCSTGWCSAVVLVSNLGAHFGLERSSEQFSGLVPLEQDKFITVLRQVLSNAQRQRIMLQQQQQQQQAQQAQQAQQGQQTGMVSFASIALQVLYFLGIYWQGMITSPETL